MLNVRKEVSKKLNGLVEYYLKNYKKMMILPIILVVFFAGAVGFYYFMHGEPINEGISLAGGVSISVTTNVSVSPVSIASSVGKTLGQPVTVTVVHPPFSAAVSGYTISTGKNINASALTSAAASALGITVNSTDSSINFVSATLGQDQLNSSLILLGMAFILVAMVSLFYFRSKWQAFSNVISIISDVINIIGVMDLLGLSFGTASIAGILMVMGYSADRNIILATNILKRSEAGMKYRLIHTLRTSITMDAAAIATFLVLLLGTNNATIQGIAVVLIIGVIFDDFTVWILNGSTQLLGLKYKEEETAPASV